MDFQIATFADFSGGQTDRYINGPVSKARTVDNYLVEKYNSIGKLRVRPGSDPLYPTQYPPGIQRIGGLFWLGSTLFAQSSRNLYYYNAGWQTLLGYGGGAVFPTPVDTTYPVVGAAWQKHLFLATKGSDFCRPVKVYSDSTGTLRAQTAGLPPMPRLLCPDAGAASYLYAAVYRSEYTVGDLTFSDVSAPFYYPATRWVPTGPGTKAQRTNYTLPVSMTVYWFSNSSDPQDPGLVNYGGNYRLEAANFFVDLYRTTNGGTTYYLTQSIAYVPGNPGYTTVSDTTTDAELVNRPILYTSGGVVENDPPPLARTVHINEGYAFYGCVREYVRPPNFVFAHNLSGFYPGGGLELPWAAEYHPNKILQSVKDDPDSVPATFYCEVDEEVVGLSSVRESVIALCTRNAYRIDGRFDELGRGAMIPVRISDTCSCVSALSVVQTFDGVFWAGQEGIYFSDGIRVLRLNEDYDISWKNFVQTDEQKRRIQGRYDAVHRRIYWTITGLDEQGDPKSECDRLLVLDLNWPLSPQSTFTTLRGGTNWQPCAIEFSTGGDLIRADARGYIFLHGDSIFSDPKVDTATAPSLWRRETTIHDYVSCAYDFQAAHVRKYAPWMCIHAKKATLGLSLALQGINDDGLISGDLKAIRSRLDPDAYLEASRHFPAKTLRFMLKQLRITNAWSVIITSLSDHFAVPPATVDVSAVNKQAVIPLGQGNFWGSGIELQGYYISFSDDNYVKEFLITGNDGARTVTFTDPNGWVTANKTGVRFTIRGYPKDESFTLMDYSIRFAPFSDSLAGYSRSESGEIG